VTPEAGRWLVKREDDDGLLWKMKDVDLVRFSKWLYYLSSAAKRVKAFKPPQETAPEQQHRYCRNCASALNLQRRKALQLLELAHSV